MSRASNLLKTVASWTEDDWLLLRHHYPRDVERFAALLRDGPPRESDRAEDLDPGAGVDDTRSETPAGPPQSPRELVWGFAAAFEYMTPLQASMRLDVVVGLLEAALRTPPPVEVPEPCEDSVGTLQLRRDVRWLEARGCRGMPGPSRFVVADMVGLSATELACLCPSTRQRFENRAHAALRALNGGTL